MDRTKHNDPLVDDENQELVSFVNNILADMQTRMNGMTDVIISRIDDMSEKLDELERSVNNVLESKQGQSNHRNPQ